MIKGYFGVPGCGKSTILVKEYRKNRRKYKYFYTVNIDIKGCKKIEKEDIRKYKFENALILWDEITLDYDNRDFKTFTDKDKEFWLLHRHMGIDIIYATQNFEQVDKKIRDLTIELWYITKSVIPILKSFSATKRIYRTININEHTSELTLGYRFCNFIESLFVSNFKLVWRRKYYKYYDSFDELQLKERKQYEEENNNNNNNDNNNNNTNWDKSKYNKL